MNTNMNKLRRKVMRRVYTVFTARVVSSPVTLTSAMFVAALFTFGDVVHVKRIVEGVTSSSLTSLPNYILNAVTHSEFITLAALGVMIFTALSIPWQLRGLWMPHRHFQREVAEA